MRQRLDLLLVERGLAESRAKAQALIMAGEVLVDGQRVDKSGAQVDVTAPVEVKSGLPYVSRGGLKLAHALDVFGLRERVVGKVALDIGASTGGFTDVLLQAGAAHVYAVDVGTNQLAWKLRTDPRVTSMEQTNIRYLQALPADRRPTTDDGDAGTGGTVATLADLATADVSYMGLELVTPAAMRLTTPDAFMLFLIKPQFEAGREQVGKGGVVREPSVHRDVIIRLAEMWRAMGLNLVGLARSPITGPAGNIEYLAHIEKRQDVTAMDLEQAIEREVFSHGN